ncbi:protein argonaute-4-like [Amblyomma americanum]
MEVVEGDEVDPREFTAPGQWFQCRGKKVVPLEKSRREIEAEQFRLRQAGRKLAAFSEIERTLPSHFPCRPAQGKLGRPIQLTANYFNIEIPAGNVFYYDVEICSETRKEAKVPENRKYCCISTKINRLVIELLVKKYRVDLNGCMPAFDGRKNLYTRIEPKFRTRTFTVDFEENQRIQKFIVKIQYAGTVNLEALHAVFDNRVSQVPHGVPHARAGARCRPDFRELRDSQNVRLNKELKGLRVKVTHLPYPRKYKVIRVTKEPAKKLFFNMEDGFCCAVADYFYKRYHRLSYPNLPCIQTGSATHPVYLPLEVCVIVEGQHCKKKLDENQTSEMIKRTAQPPAKRFNETRQTVRDLVSSSDQCLHEFGIKISTEQTQLRGRVLDPPSLVFENNSIGKPREGTWELRGRHFYEPAMLTRWTLLNLSRFAQRDSLHNFVRMLIRVGQELGMCIEQPLDVTTTDANRKPVRNILLEEQRKTVSLEMVIIMLAKNTNYAEIKQVAETEIGLRTQCVMDNNVIKKCSAALIINLCQKINAKLDGINSLLPKEKPKIFQKPVIIIGADVTHPAPGDKLRLSIAACVGSLDSIPSKFHASIRIQMEDSAATSPWRSSRISRVSAIRLACQELSPNETYEPALTFTVVQKRHHTRFMPTNDRDGVGQCRNVPPGTTVDSVVTHPLDFDFYLCSHFGNQVHSNGMPSGAPSVNSRYWWL